MRRFFLFFALAGFVWLSALAFFFPKQAALVAGTPGVPATLAEVQSAVATVDPNSFSLLTEPQAGVAPVLAMIDGAKKSVDLVIYQLSDTQVEDALIAAQARGVAVRVLLNQGYWGKKTGDYGRPEPANQPAYDYLQAHAVPVHWTPAYFALTHQKTLTVDGDDALIMTFNLTPKYYATGRDFAVDDHDSSDVIAIEKTFEEDWNGNKTTAPRGSDLLWSPGSEDLLLSLINSASSTLDVYNEEMADQNVISALEAAAERGVSVRLDMTYATAWKVAFAGLKAAGVQVRTWASSSKILYIHAKMILVDSKTVFIGSENFSAGSLNDNRELGLILSAPTIIASLEQTFEADWARARPF